MGMLKKQDRFGIRKVKGIVGSILLGSMMIFQSPQARQPIIMLTKVTSHKRRKARLLRVDRMKLRILIY